MPANGPSALEELKLWLIEQKAKATPGSAKVYLYVLQYIYDQEEAVATLAAESDSRSALARLVSIVRPDTEATGIHRFLLWGFPKWTKIRLGYYEADDSYGGEERKWQVWRNEAGLWSASLVVGVSSHTHAQKWGMAFETMAEARQACVERAMRLPGHEYV